MKTIPKLNWLGSFRRLGDRLREVTGLGYDALTNVADIQQVRAIGRWPVIAVLPFESSHASSEEDQPGPGVGAILAAQLRRDLLVTREVSVRDGGDTPPVGFSQYLEAHEAGRVGQHLQFLVGGWIEADRLGVELRFAVADLTCNPPRIARGGLAGNRLKPQELTRLTARALAEHLAPKRDQQFDGLWEQDPLTSWEDLCAAARSLESEDLAEHQRLLLDRRATVASLAAAGYDLDEVRRPRRLARAVLQRDPHNPEVLFKFFMQIWKGDGLDAAAARVLRHAVLVAPGHGKSHMCLPHVMRRRSNQERVLSHSETGYRLLRGNNFAISNFMLYLERYRVQGDRYEELLGELLEADDSNPEAYRRAIEYLQSCGKLAGALDCAERLAELCRPPINPRTLYCYQQNPQVARAIERGTFDPYKDACKLVRRLQRRLRRKPTANEPASVPSPPTIPPAPSEERDGPSMN